MVAATDAEPCEGQSPEPAMAACAGKAANVCMPGSPEQLEELKGQIMAEIEAKLSQKEESLWRRGQVEIRRLSLEQAQVASSVSTLQERQAAIVAENQKIRGALLEVTSKFETVVMEMREVLRALPQRAAGAGSNTGEGLSPSPSAASTVASEAARVEEVLSTPLSGQVDALGALWSSCERSKRREAHMGVPPSPVPMWHPQRGCGDGNLSDLSGMWDSEDGLGDSKTFCTPPRASPSSSGCDMDLSGAPPPPASWRGLAATASPAVLSLASALPSGSSGAASSHVASALNVSTGSCSTAASMSMHPSPTVGLKRLHLAECLKSKADGAGAAASSASGATAAAVPATPVMEKRTGGTRGQLAAAALATPMPPWETPPSPAKNFDFLSIELLKEAGCSTLGIEVNEVDGTSLRIESIDEDGLVARHNLRQDDDACRVLPGDRIIEANGVQHDPARMLHECKVKQKLAFTLVRDIAGDAPTTAGASASTGRTGGSGSLGGVGASVGGASASTEAEPSPMPMGPPPPPPSGGDETAEAAAALAASMPAPEQLAVAGSPATKLRPEATAFVPSSAQKENAGPQGPPGLEKSAGAAASAAVQQDSAAAAGAAEGKGEAVKRVLFH